MQRHFDEELADLRRNLATMGTLAESMIRQSVQLLTRHRGEVAAQIRRDEDEVNRLHLAIDDSCMRLLVLRQPAAADLRLVASTLKINSDLERIGDQAINLLVRAESLDGQPEEWPRIDLSPLIRVASTMVADALDAFIKKDVGLARKVLDDENMADDLRDQIEESLIRQAESQKHSFRLVLQLVLVTHHLERIADHATNIAEDVIYLVEGKDIRHHHIPE